MTLPRLMPSNSSLLRLFRAVLLLCPLTPLLHGADPLMDRTQTELSRWQPRLPETTAKNAIPNSSFELASYGWSSLGEPAGWSTGLSSLYGTVTERESHEGRRSLEIVLGPGKTPVASFDVWPAATTVQHSPIAMNLGWITIKPGETYTLSAYMKANRPGIPARLVMRFGNDLSASPSPHNEEKTVTLTEKWERYSFTFKANDVSVCVGVGPDLRNQPDAEATVWIDAVQFERSDRATAYTPHADLEVSLDSGRLGHLYSVGSPVTLRLAVSNRAARSTEVNVSVSLTDYFDEPVPGFQHTVRVDAKGEIEESIPLPPPGPGYYRLHAKITAPGLNDEIRFPLALIHEFAGSDALFGLNHPTPTIELMDQFRRAGVLWGRDWSCDWHQVEPQQDVFDWAESDRQIARLEQSGWKIMSMLPGFPSTKWSSSVPADHVVPPG
ncbi:MAG TPA: carbohydrate binding domain-containing protein, partial [Opitutus sp.]|nr:carbohydrate binding domain-containing protein [Opitutus sp.]